MGLWKLKGWKLLLPSQITNELKSKRRKTIMLPSSCCWATLSTDGSEETKVVMKDICQHLAQGLDPSRPGLEPDHLGSWSVPYKMHLGKEGNTGWSANLKFGRGAGSQRRRDSVVIALFNHHPLGSRQIAKEMQWKLQLAGWHLLGFPSLKTKPRLYKPQCFSPSFPREISKHSNVFPFFFLTSSYISCALIIDGCLQ